MREADLEKLRIGVSPLTGTIYLYEPCKHDPENALKKRDFTEEIMGFAMNNWDMLEKRRSELLKE